jgi:hypothetical protein
MTTEQQASPADTTQEHQASRTLVKSPPELWAECSDAGSLARHLGEFGEIRITRLEPDTDVAWEGERASGTVRIEPSAWGTRVTLTAEVAAASEVPRPEPHPLGESAAGVPDEVPDRPDVPTDSPEEDGDATVEEALEEPDPALANAPRRFRIRWPRLRARKRATFARLEEPTDSGDPAPCAEIGSVPPPDAQRDTSSEPEPDGDGDASTVGPDVEELGVAHLDPPLDAQAILSAALESLGQAHHRPFSRA